MLPTRVWAVIIFGAILGTSGTTFFLVSDYAKSGGFGDDAVANMTANGRGMFMHGSLNDRLSEASGLDSGTPGAIYDLRGASIMADGDIILVLDGKGWSQHGDGVPWYAEGAGTLTRIFNADTLEIDGEKFQLSLVNAPEGRQWGAVRAMALVEAVCRVGSTVYYDIDDMQPKDRYGRHLALVWCSDMQKPLNQVLLETGHAKVLKKYCGESEFEDLLCKRPQFEHVMVLKDTGGQ